MSARIFSPIQLVAIVACTAGAFVMFGLTWQFHAMDAGWLDTISAVAGTLMLAAARDIYLDGDLIQC